MVPDPIRDAARTRDQQERRDALRVALAAVYSGAGYVEADAVADHLDDLGFRVERIGGKR